MDFERGRIHGCINHPGKHSSSCHLEHAWVTSGMDGYFAVLAFYPYGIKREQPEQKGIPPSTFPVTPAPMMVHVIASPPIAQPVKTGRYDTDEMEIASIR